MHVGGAVIDRLRQELIDERDDGGLIARAALQPGRRSLLGDRHAASVEDPLHGAGANAVVPPDRPCDLLLAGQRQAQAHPQQHPQLIKAADIERIGDGDRQHVVAVSNRQHAVAPGETRRHQRQRRRVDGQLIEGRTL